MQHAPALCYTTTKLNVIRKTILSEFCAFMADRIQHRMSSSQQAATPSLSFGIQRILQDHSRVADTQLTQPPSIPLPHHRHVPITASSWLGTPLPWRPYFGVVTMTMDHMRSAWLSSHASHLALSIATTGAMVS